MLGFLSRVLPNLIQSVELIIVGERQEVTVTHQAHVKLFGGLSAFLGELFILLTGQVFALLVDSEVLLRKLGNESGVFGLVVQIHQEHFNFISSDVVDVAGRDEVLDDSGEQPIGYVLFTRR